MAPALCAHVGPTAKGHTERMRDIVLFCILLGGCAVNKPPEYSDAAVQAVCAAKDGDTVSVTYKNQVKLVTVDFVPSWEELYSLCGDTGGACVNMETFEIHMIDDRHCAQRASHELGHVFAVSGMDTYRKIESRRQSFYEG
ncbi:MAG: hypothetical protein ACI9DH_000746 [Halioglobus sp.]